MKLKSSDISEKRVDITKSASTKKTRIDILFEELNQANDSEKEEQLIKEIILAQGMPYLHFHFTREQNEQINYLQESFFYYLVLALLGVVRGRIWEKKYGIIAWREKIRDLMDFRAADVHYP